MAEIAYLLDTGICIAALQGQSDRLRAVLALQSVGSLGISSISVARIAMTYNAGTGVPLDLADFFAIVQPVAFDHHAALRYGTLPLRRGGFDRLIAAQALVLDVTLVTDHAADFKDIAGLRIEDWTQ